MSEVWAGHQIELGFSVAVKLHDPSRAPFRPARGRFRREARALAQLGGPHLVQLYDSGVWAGRPYLVMERLRGETLHDRLQRRGSLSLDETSNILCPLARALTLMHDAGLAHRDVKPSNVFLVNDAAKESIKLIDLGIAKTLGSRGGAPASRSTEIVGSPAYMSPEQARGAPIDLRCDLWALAALLFKMLTGREAFTGDDLPDLLARICRSRYPSATALNAMLPAEIDTFFGTAFARSIERRFQTSAELTAAFSLCARCSAPAALQLPGATEVARLSPDWARTSATQDLTPGGYLPLLRDMASWLAPAVLALPAGLAFIKQRLRRRASWRPAATSLRWAPVERAPRSTTVAGAG